MTANPETTRVYPVTIPRKDQAIKAEILRLRARGFSAAGICRRLNLSERTVKEALGIWMPEAE